MRMINNELRGVSNTVAVRQPAVAEVPVLRSSRQLRVKTADGLKTLSRQGEATRREKRGVRGFAETRVEIVNQQLTCRREGIVGQCVENWSANQPIGQPRQTAIRLQTKTGRKAEQPIFGRTAVIVQKRDNISLGHSRARIACHPWPPSGLAQQCEIELIAVPGDRGRQVYRTSVVNHDDLEAVLRVGKLR